MSNSPTPPPTEPSVAPFPNRKITDHRVNGLNEAIEISAVGAPGKGGAPNTYSLALYPIPEQPASRFILLPFQSQPIQGPGDFDGFTNEALLAVVIDRLRCFQEGPFCCRENARALTLAEESLMWLQKRTRERIARGVEGSYAR